MGELFKHKKRGRVYEKLGEGKFQTAHELLDGVPIVIYRDVIDDKWWARPVSEFNDGRFEKL